MNYSSIHTHTTFCDGKDDIETCCRRAREKGLVSIGFSAHAPIGRKTGFKSDWHLRDDRLEEYIGAVRAARSRWEGRLQVFLGLEVDYVPGLMGPSDADYRDLGLDYLIGSVHYLIPPRGAEPFTVDGSPEELEKGLREAYGGDGEALAGAYWDALEAMIRSGGFDVLGHADLIKKNNRGNRIFNPSGAAGLRRTGEIARALGAAHAAGGAARSRITVEVNTGGLNRKKIDDTYPSIPFLRLFCENHVPAIITADAHQAEDLDGHYGEAREALLAAGYTETVLFDGRKNNKALWKKEFLTTNDTNQANIGFPPGSCCS
ncbi:histidinol-phosphatase [Spirochaetia bacterium]|nr:histidinol-phosphatase [Spirochaetia bacterium]